ncbi:MAG: zinc ribbon domain-containing protein [Clostridia bacterium]|nr:zinc ribbon domain-containing protein [Clostridia bacterium]
MFCKNCGAQIPSGNAFCGNCGAPAQQSNPNNATPVNATPVQSSSNNNGGFFKMPSKGSKGFAAIASALMVLPASLCGVIDLLVHRNDGWSFYVIGALMVMWMVTVYPVLNITPAPVTAMISFFSVVAYILFVIGRIGFAERLYKIVVPLLILLAVFVAIDSALAGAGKLKGLHAVSLISLEGVLYLMAVEATIDNLATGEINLRWSLILACFFVSAIALAEAVNYVIRINKK